MAYLRTEYWQNGEDKTPVTIYSCDITGKEICEANGWYGNDKIHISEDGLYELIEQWIKRESNGFTTPLFLWYLEGRFTHKIKTDRYIPKELRKKVLEKYKHECVKCGATEKLEIDHIHPVSKKGLNEFSNLQVLCKTCNIRKSDKIIVNNGK